VVDALRNPSELGIDLHWGMNETSADLLRSLDMSLRHEMTKDTLSQSVYGRMAQLGWPVLGSEKGESCCLDTSPAGIVA